MFSPSDVVLIAVSGGPDSVAMLHALHTRSHELGITLHVAHINHGIRGEQSNIDEVFVRNLAHELGSPISVGRFDVPALARELRTGEEDAARTARYTFLRQCCTELGADKIAVGHTADDRAESVLLNIIRGCGIDGLGSIRPVSHNIVRPLIEATRADVERYIAEHALPYRVDESNADVTYTRNRVRHELIPMLEHDFNPEIKTALVRLAEVASAQSDLMASLAESTVDSSALRDGLDAAALRHLPTALQWQVIRSEVARAKGDLLDITFEQVALIADGLTQGDDFTITLPPGDLFASQRDGVFAVGRREEAAVVESFEHVLFVPGETHIPAIGLTVKCEIVERPTPCKLPANEAMIDAGSVVGALRVRSVIPGDRIVPIGMSGHKKLQDVFVDKKVPRRERAKAAVICDDEKIVWVVGVVASELGKVTEATETAIHLVVERDR